MDGGPTGRAVCCPECDVDAMAIVPDGSKIIDDEGQADGKVWVNCRHCEARFLAYYRTKR